MCTSDEYQHNSFTSLDQPNFLGYQMCERAKTIGVVSESIEQNAFNLAHLANLSCLDVYVVGHIDTIVCQQQTRTELAQHPNLKVMLERAADDKASQAL
uniref:AlNc14C96G5854 protein n=1 Tax=Albugo laibachii Nc14 TaxID=890382 RepID=F0WGX8_9STRA|nr:AlNc14C96G5854 [Albugo laibachii Nc14]|eukprot:CCA20493.1 AlNc14C96G5854 [Albugo laibachii Nc14]